MKFQKTFRLTGYLLTLACTIAVIFALSSGIELVYRLCNTIGNQVSISVTLANQRLTYFF